MPTEPLSPERLDELARRCEAADASEQRALIEEAWLLVNPAPPARSISALAASNPAKPQRFDPSQAVWAKAAQRLQDMLDAEAYESAALTLVPEGMDWAIDCAMGGVSAAVGFWPDAPSQSGATPALAICAAALLARAKEANDGNE